MEHILLVEDKAELREMLAQALARMGYVVTPAANIAEALAAIDKRRFSAVLTDLKLPSGSGMDVLKTVLAADSAIPIIIMTAYGSIAEAVAAMREGAYDFIQKPVELEHLRHLLARAVEREQLLRENLVLKEEYARRFGFPRIIGEHPAMLESARQMQRSAASDSTVLLLGESGTGKELYARAIHQLSPRASKSFLALNCAAIPETLVENELFGHERGAFTGATARSIGKFELARGGTIFLDEIGELPLAVQGKLLRVLEERMVERLGGAGNISVDVRIIAATNCDLEMAAAEGAFRRDLYYRLAVFPIYIPPLRDRGEDSVLLAEHFLERFRRELKKPKLRLAQNALSAIRSYHWPGNVRELQNVIERATILHEGELRALDLGLEVRAAAAAFASASHNAAVAEFPAAPGTLPSNVSPASERERLETILRDCKWNKATAAKRLGISYKTLLHKIHAYELD